MTALSRRTPRYRLDIAAKAQALLGGETAICRTKDVSDVGLSLDTAAWFPLGTRLAVALFDPERGTALEVIGDVIREATAPSWTLGLVLIEPPVEWRALVAGAANQRAQGKLKKRGKRLRVLVVGDEHRQRGAMALYVTSGWDVLFAADQDSITEVLGHAIELDAVIAELDATDPRVGEVMERLRRARPGARRIVRGSGTCDGDLVERVVGRDAGVEVLLDAITAELPAS